MLMLQKEPLINKNADIRWLLTKRMDMWENCDIDVSMSEAIRCNKSSKIKRRNAAKQEQEHEHSTKIFHRLMIQGKLRAAVRWITERECKGLLKPTNKIKVKTPDDDETVMSVMEILQMKHPNPGKYYKEGCTPYFTVPAMPAMDVTGAHIQIVARRLHGAAGLSSSDAAAWQDWLLRYSARERLRDVVAYLTRVIANTTVPWEFIRAIMASSLIALDKCPGLRPI